MRILYAITKSNWGGAQRHVFDLAVAMKQKGHDVWVALGGDGILKRKLEEAGIYTFSIAVLGRDISLVKDSVSFKEIYSVIKSKKPDILHLHSTKVIVLGSVAGKLLGVKLIIQTIHGWAFNEDRPIYERLVFRIFSWLTMFLCHATIVLSEREYKQAVGFPWVKDRVKLIPLGIQPPTFISIEGAKQAIAKFIGMDNAEFSKKIVIGTVAELHPNKGLTYLIDAMSFVIANQPNAISVIVSDGEQRRNLERQIRERKLEHVVYLPGYLNNVAEYFKAFTIFALPSIKEGLPYTILEAGSASLPVVATTVGGIPEMIEDMKSGILIQAKNPRELAHALSFMIEHPTERKKYGAALKERVATKFPLDRMIWMIEELYRE